MRSMYQCFYTNSCITNCEAFSLRIQRNQFEKGGIQMMKRMFHVAMFTPFVHHGSLKRIIMGMDASDLDVIMNMAISTWTSLMYTYQADFCCHPYTGWQNILLHKVEHAKPN